MELMETFTFKDGREIALRFAKPSDYEAVQAYLEQLATETIFTNQYPGKPRPTQEEFEKAISNCWMKLALEGNKVVGLLSIHPHKPNHPWLNKTCSFGVHMLEAYHHNGLGHHFMEMLEQYAKEHKMHRIEGTVRHQNVNAIALYLKHGFLIEGMKKECAYINGVWHNEYMIAKILEAA